MTTSRADILAEIERLDAELRRVSNELEQLRRKAEPPRSGRTMAFASPVSSSPPPSAKSSPTSHAPPTSQPRGGDTGRRVASPAIELDFSEPPPPVQSQRAKADSGRDHGRYGYVDKPRTSGSGR